MAAQRPIKGPDIERFGALLEECLEQRRRYILDEWASATTVEERERCHVAYQEIELLTEFLSHAARTAAE